MSPSKVHRFPVEIGIVMNVQKKESCKVQRLTVQPKETVEATSEAETASEPNDLLNLRLQLHFKVVCRSRRLSRYSSERGRSVKYDDGQEMWHKIVQHSVDDGKMDDSLSFCVCAEVRRLCRTKERFRP